MPSKVRANFHGADEFARDLESFRLGLGRKVRDAIRRAAEPVATLTGRLTPRGSGPTTPTRPSAPGRRNDNALSHIADTMAATATPRGAAILTRHPGGPVTEYGGTIAPNGAPITIKRAEMAHKAGEEKRGDMERDVARALDELAAEHGLR